MVNRNELVNAFAYGEKKGKASSLSIQKESKGTSLYSYATPIAYRNEKGDIFMTDKKFSKSTSAQQSTLKNNFDVKVESNEEFKKRLDKEGVDYGFSRL